MVWVLMWVVVGGMGGCEEEMWGWGMMDNEYGWLERGC